MREYLELFTEGVGLSNRVPGERFKQKNTEHTITFKNLEFYPPQGQLPENELSATVKQVTGKLGKVTWSNKHTAGVGGFGIAHFVDDATGEDIYVGRWFRTISPNPAQNNFPHTAIPGDYQYQSPRATKEHTGYKPSDILTQFENNTADSIYKQIVTKFTEASPIAQAAKIFLEADTLPITVPKGDINFTGFRDYFCELLQPIALIKGLPITGNADEAERVFFGENGFNTCTVTFQSGVAGGLFDSLLTNSDGKQIKLSSKGKSGAKASAVNLLDSVKELENTPNGAKLIKKYDTVISILEIIKDFGHVGAPLNLAVSFGMLTAQEAEQVKRLKSYGPTDEIIGKKILSKRLEALYQSRKAKDMSRIIPLEHMLAAIAYMVADKVNTSTDFSKAASDILNHGALVQMYTEASEAGDTIVIKGFRAVYPSQTVTGVLLDASKSYMSTQGKGNFVFNILKNGATVKDIPEDPAVSAERSAEKTADIEKKIQNIAQRKPISNLRPTRGQQTRQKR